MPQGWFDISGAKGLRLEGNFFGGMGIRASAPADFTAVDNLFVGVDQAFSIAGGEAEVRGTRITGGAPRSGRSFYGYERSSSPPVPAFCPRCKSVFKSTHYQFASWRVYFKGNLDVCPNPECGFDGAEVAEGLLDLSGAVVRIILADGFTRDMVAALDETASLLAAGEISEGQAVSQLAAIMPSLKERLGFFLGRGKAPILWFIGIVAFFQAIDYATGVDHALWRALGLQPDYIGVEWLQMQPEHHEGDQPSDVGPGHEAPGSGLAVELSPDPSGDLHSDSSAGPR